MKKSSYPLFFAALALVISTQAFAEEVYVHSPSMKTSDFSTILESTHRLDLKRTFLRKQSIQNLDRLSISTEGESLRHSLQLLDQLPLREVEKESELFIFEKMGLDQLSTVEQKRYLGLLTAGAATTLDQEAVIQRLRSGLMGKENTDGNFWLSSDELAKLFNSSSRPESLIFIDAVPLNVIDQKISVMPHQWIYISNSAEPVMILGSLADFLQALTELKTFSDQCGELITPWPNLPDFTLRNVGSAGDCDLSGNPPRDIFPSFNGGAMGQNQQSAKMKEEKTQAWMLPAAILTMGLGIAYFHNKQVSFHLPSFRF